MVPSSWFLIKSCFTVISAGHPLLKPVYPFLVAGVQEKLGVMNKGTVYALWDYEAQNNDELSFHEGDAITILRRKDENETEWWWARLGDREGYVPKNLLGVSTQHTGLNTGSLVLSTQSKGAKTLTA